MITNTDTDTNTNTDTDKYFNEAVNLTMKFEVNSFFDPSDPDVQKGLIDTPTMRKKVGYVNHPNDPGGITKFGIAQNFTTVDVQSITYDQAKKIYYDLYWVRFRAAEIPYPLNLVYFDSTVNHRPAMACTMLQRAVKTTPDGKFGPLTLYSCFDVDPLAASYELLDHRDDFYQRLVKKRPYQFGVFLKGWLNRTKLIREYLDQSVV